MSSIGRLFPLFLSAGILLAGNGLFGTLVALRGAEEGFASTMIGFIGTAYYIGFLLALRSAPSLIRNVGHIRVFAALAASASAAALAMAIFVDAWLWVFLRIVVGYCSAGLFTAIESWINDQVDNNNRAQALSIYVLVDLAAVTGAQFLLPAVGIVGFEIFAVTAILYAISLVPVALSTRGQPEAPKDITFDLKKLWSLSPIACIGCFAIGLTNSAFRLVGPVYASLQNLDVSGVAIFMSAGIVGGAITQYPVGMISDRFDRRYVLMIGSIGAALAGVLLASASAGNPGYIYGASFLFGATAFPLYSVSVAHANDNLEPGQTVMAAAGMLFFFAIGATIGPFVGSLIMELGNAAGLFWFTTAIHIGLVLSAIVRLSISPEAPEYQRRFTMLLRTSPSFFGLAKRRGSKTYVDPTSPEATEHHQELLTQQEGGDEAASVDQTVAGETGGTT